MDRFLTPFRAVLLAALTAFLAGALATIVGGVPVPEVHDEFSYILGAETFAHGRLTNPAHPQWQWFETFHVISQPTRMSKYPPAPAAMMAIGTAAGLPIAGAWLAAALAAGAIAWMLWAWLPPSWAFAGGIITALHPVTFEWSHSYWGGAAALAGGALILGAARRLTGESVRTRDSIVLGLGVLLVANSRPWEGLLLVVTLLCVGVAMKLLRVRVLVPALIVVALGGAFMLFDNFRVTGNALLLPYSLYSQQYDAIPPLVFQRPHVVTYRNWPMQALAARYASFYATQVTPRGFVLLIPAKFLLYVNTAFRITAGLLPVEGTILEMLLLVPLAFAVRIAWRDRMLRAVAIVFLVAFVLAVTLTVFPRADYVAPLAPLVLLLWLAGLRTMPRAVVAAVPVAVAIGVACSLIVVSRRELRFAESGHRLAVARHLATVPGAHLVLVRYAPEHKIEAEWVENAADIDAQRIVWAHDLGDNAPLLRHFAGRHLWRVTAGPHPLVERLSP